MEFINPRDNELFDFGYSIINFGKYRLFNYLSVYSIDSKYLYSLLKSKIYTKKDILSDFLELLEFRESELYNQIDDDDDEITISIDSNDESDDDD